jgi:hypothetical protein
MRFAPLMTFLVVCCLIAPAGAGTLIAIDSSRVLYEINMINGVKTQIGTVSSNAGTTAGLARNATNGTIYLTSTGTDELFTVDLSTGTATLVGSYGTTTVVMHGLEWDGSTGTLYGGSNGNLFTIDTTTGFATQVGASGLTSFTNLVHVPTTNTLYATNSGTDSFYLVARRTRTGSPTTARTGSCTWSTTRRTTSTRSTSRPERRRSSDRRARAICSDSFSCLRRTSRTATATAPAPRARAAIPARSATAARTRSIRTAAS